MPLYADLNLTSGFRISAISVSDPDPQPWRPDLGWPIPDPGMTKSTVSGSS